MIKDNRDNTGKIRDENGRFLPGQSGNPKGRPKDSFSLTAMLKRRLQEVPEGQKRTYAEFLIEKLLKEAVLNGDPSLIKIILSYSDGLPTQVIKNEGGTEVNVYPSRTIVFSGIDEYTSGKSSVEGIHATESPDRTGSEEQEI